MQYWQRLHEYLVELDRILDQKLEITLIGGSALILQYHHIRVTYDIDVLNSPDARKLEEVLRAHSELDDKYKLPMHIVEGSFFPLMDDFLEKRIRYSQSDFKYLKIYVLDIYNLILSKLDRCNSKDRDDIEWLKDNFMIDVEKFIEAYKNARLYVLNPDRVDGNFLYILDVVFGKVIGKERLAID